MTTSRHRAVTPDEAVPCAVTPGRLIFDPVRGRQVGGGEHVLVHPGLVDAWIRNGWILAAAHAEVPKTPARRPTESSSAKPHRSRRDTETRVE